MALSATNVGRMEATVVMRGFHLRNTAGQTCDALYPDDKTLPASVRPHASAQFVIRHEEIESGMAERRMTAARGFVRLATGEVVDAPDDCVTIQAF
jgi:hypothetical protein